MQLYQCLEGEIITLNVHIRKNQISQISYYSFHFLFKKLKTALAGVAQWIDCRPANQKVAGSIPSQGTCLCCGPGPQLGACKRQLIDASPAHRFFSPFLPPFPSL